MGGRVPKRVCESCITGCSETSRRRVRAEKNGFCNQYMYRPAEPSSIRREHRTSNSAIPIRGTKDQIERIWPSIEACAVDLSIATSTVRRYLQTGRCYRGWKFTKYGQN